jgi:hypothetical protein
MNTPSDSLFRPPHVEHAPSCVVVITWTGVMRYAPAGTYVVEYLRPKLAAFMARRYLLTARILRWTIERGTPTPTFPHTTTQTDSSLISRIHMSLRVWRLSFDSRALPVANLSGP